MSLERNQHEQYSQAQEHLRNGENLSGRVKLLHAARAMLARESAIDAR